MVYTANSISTRYSIYYYFYCILILVKYSAGRKSSSSSDVPSSAFGASRLSVMKNKALAVTGAYCKSLYSAKEAEELLNFVSQQTHLEEFAGWKRYTHFGKDLENPQCSAFPNALYPKRNRLAKLPISRNKFFQRQSIDVPIQPGRMQNHLNEFRFIHRDPVQRLFLECSCSIISNSVQEYNLCADGTVYLSKGVCADMSFFVHTLNPSGNFNVVAHIFFIRPKNNA